MKFLPIFILAFTIGKASAQNFSWARNEMYYGSADGKATVFDAAGNIYHSTVEQTSSLTKRDPSGNIIWTKTYESKYQTAHSMCVDGLGNLYVAGTFTAAYPAGADFEPGPGVYSLQASNGAFAIFVLKIDPAGNIIWGKSLPSSNGPNHTGNNAELSSPRSIKVDNLGNVIIGGLYHGSIDFDPGLSTYNLPSSGGAWDGFIVKLDALGNLVWATNLGAAGYDFVGGLDLDATGNIYAAGRFAGSVDFDPGAGVYNLATSGNTDLDNFLIKVSPAGQLVWAKSIVTGASNTEVLSLQLDALANIYITGHFHGTADFDPSTNQYNLTSNGLADVFVSKYNSAGNFIWAKSAGSFSDDVGRSIAIDPAGFIYVAGTFSGIVDFDPGNSVVNQNAIHGPNIFIQKLDLNGQLAWVGSMTGATSSMVNSIAVGINGDIALTGFVNSIIYPGNFDLNPGPGTVNMGLRMYRSWILVKLTAMPLPVSLLRFDIVKRGFDIAISWQTATEINSDRFEIQMSDDGSTFRKVDDVRAAGNSSDIKSYSYIHIDGAKQSSSKTLFYRLKQIDLDGKYEYSPIRSINLSVSAQELKIYPNPANNEIIITAVDLQISKKAYRIINQTGQLITKGHLENNSNTINISQLLPGIYYVQVEENDGGRLLRFVKQ